MAMRASVHTHGRGAPRAGLRSARQKSMAITPYSVRWAHLRTRKTIWSTVASWRRGKKKRTSGAMMREERSKDFVSPEAEKITPIHSSTGSQYLRNERGLDTMRGSALRRNDE